jgi:phosphate transport system protein
VESYLFASDRDRIVKRVMEMGQKAIEALRDAVDAFVNSDSALADRVIGGDADIDAIDEEIDLECLRSIAMRQPVRDELRFIFAVLKTTTDLERAGDHAVNIARWAKNVGRRQNTAADSTLTDMMDVATSMLRDALRAFKDADGGTSEEICRRDDQLDAMYEDLSSQLIELAAFKAKDVSAVRAIVAQMWVARYLERVGDHSTNIAERVYFVDRGKNLAKE